MRIHFTTPSDNLGDVFTSLFHHGRIPNEILDKIFVENIVQSFVWRF